MSSRFGGLFSILNTRDYQFLEFLTQEYPFEDDNKGLSEMSNRELLDLVRTYKEGTSREVQSASKNEDLSTEEGLGYLVEMRKINSRLRTIQKKIENKIARSK